MGNDHPTLSVVITCFNYERYVGDAILSALTQTVPPDEIVVVNDGSTDGSAGVLAAFGDRIRVVSQANAGQIAALNNGYAHARGDIVLFLDADDLLHREALEAVHRAWRPGCTKVQFELEVINGQGEMLGRRFCNYVQPYGPEEIRREFDRFGTYVWPVLTGNAYSRSFLDLVMPLTVKKAPDGLLNTVAPLYGDVMVVPRALGYYRLHDANQSYHGAASASIGERFAKQVAIRVVELQALREHAASHGVALPKGNLLDYDLPSVNYRLMNRKLGERYEGDEADTAAGLWRAGMSLLRKRPLPAALKLMHAAWLTALLCSPRWLARPLILLRFSRAALVQPVRRKFAAWFGTGKTPHPSPSSPTT
ncbi:glycosyltransferase family 2 protein [Piscinibacter terrae]|uniref:Glycosyltransferase family 2 protein n=1 Tax=Piscinibacter terrae TaxID=2496871 RepID=A0A3N7HYP3_9BURK|nr:glycosyltransferase family A protein [Albitalea terrae]RQP26556.1 glycosyltransferase family 2 protein [Albitalea terrae]